jgi:hypothetical protein
MEVMKMTNTKDEKREVTFNVENHLGVIRETKNGWTKELNLVSWNDGEPKFDIREWSPDHQHMSRGITLAPEEMKSLKEIIDTRIPELRDPALKAEPNKDMER